MGGQSMVDLAITHQCFVSYLILNPFPPGDLFWDSNPSPRLSICILPYLFVGSAALDGRAFVLFWVFSLLDRFLWVSLEKIKHMAFFNPSPPWSICRFGSARWVGRAWWTWPSRSTRPKPSRLRTRSPRRCVLYIYIYTYIYTYNR